LVEWYRTWQSSPSTMNDFTLSQIARYGAMIGATNAAPPGGNKPH